MNILEIENLCKSFGGRDIIRNLSLTVPENTIYGFLGQNGAGKTTTMKMILGLLKPDSGKISVYAKEVAYGNTKTNRHIGFLSDVPEFYGYMKPTEYLALCGEITGLDRKTIKARSEELLSLVGLGSENKRIRGFSRGMKQRLGIAQALLTNPKLLICDEPTSALDPVGRREILDILLSVKEKTTVVFSTHILSDAERICDHVAVLHKGSFVLNGPLCELKRLHKPDTLQMEFASENDLKRFTSNPCIHTLLQNASYSDRTVILKAQNKNINAITNNNTDSNTNTIADINHVAAQIYNAVYTTKIYPIKVEVLEPALENLFLEVMK